MLDKKWITDIIIEFVHGLEQKPAYILIFGICMLFVIFGFGSGIYGFINNEIIALYLSFLSFVIALIAATIVIKIVEVPSSVMPIENDTINQSDILFSLVFEEKNTKFENTKKNGHYWIIGKEKFDADLLLEFKGPDQMLGWPGGWVWRPPQRIPLNSTITMELLEDNGRKWTLKQTPDRLMIPLYPKEI